MVTVIDLLEVLREFEPLEPQGVGPGLIAWELDVPRAEVVAVIDLAVERQLIFASGHDRRVDERLWRLTDDGRARLLDI